MLLGSVFLCHEVGMLPCARLGGRLHALSGDYTFVWWLAAVPA
jgi:hypothetical protein